MSELASNIIVCDRCKKRSSGCKTNCMSGSGNYNADIMIVGEHPTGKDDIEGRPFVSNSGTYMRKRLFRGSGINEDNVYMTNAVKCGSPNKYKKITPDEMRNCRDRLWEEVREVKPKVIIAMGNATIYSLLTLDKLKGDDDDKEDGMKGIKKWRGKQCWHKELNCWIIPTLTPGYLMMDRDDNGVKLWHDTELVIEDFELALKLAHQPRPVMKYPTYAHVTDKQVAIKLMEYFATLPAYAIDTEAEDLEWWRTPLCGVSLAENSSHGYYVDFTVLNLTDPSIRKALHNMLRSPGYKYLHNSAYDVKLLQTHGFRVGGKIFDTMHGAHLLDENFYKGLKQNLWVRSNFGGYDFALDKYRRENKITKSFKGIPGVVMAPYAALDAVGTYILAEKEMAALDGQGILPLERKVLTPARKVFTGIEYRGMRVSKEKAIALDGIMTRIEDKVKNRIYTIAGQEINLNSPKQKQKLFYETLGMKPFKETDSSTEENPSYSTDGDSLDYIISQGGKGGQIARALQDYSYMGKQHSTFVKAILTNARQHEDGNWYIHTNYNMTGTVSLRISCYNPCTHNIPNDGLIKGLYVSRVGRSLLYADIKAAEMRVLAVYAKEKRLMEAFAAGKDVHTEVWRMMFNKGPDDVPTHEERRIAKQIGFGLVYGMGARAVSLKIGTTVAVAKEYIKKFFAGLPSVHQFFEDTYEELYEYGYVTTLFGSRRRLPDIYSDNNMLVSRAKRQAVNTKVQAVAAIYTYVGLNRISSEIKKRGLKSVPVHSVHDCVLVDTVPEEEEQVKVIIKEAFEKPIKILPVKMAVDVKKFENWGQDCEGSRIADIIKSVGLELTNEEKELFKEWVA